MLFGKTRKKPKGRNLSSSLKFNFSAVPFGIADYFFIL